MLIILQMLCGVCVYSQDNVDLIYIEVYRAKGESTLYKLTEYSCLHASIKDSGYTK